MKQNNYWIYNNNKVTSLNEFPETVFGFIYYISIYTNQGKMYYIGKKQFYSKVKRRFGKKETALLTDKRAKKWEYKITETNWLVYSSSCKELRNIIETGDYTKIKKEIIDIAYSDLELKYKEVKYILQHDAVIKENYFNAGVSIKVIGKLKFNQNE